MNDLEITMVVLALLFIAFFATVHYIAKKEIKKLASEKLEKKLKPIINDVVKEFDTEKRLFEIFNNDEDIKDITALYDPFLMCYVITVEHGQISETSEAHDVRIIQIALALQKINELLYAGQRIEIKEIFDNDTQS